MTIRTALTALLEKHRGIGAALVPIEGIERVLDQNPEPRSPARGNSRSTGYAPRREVVPPADEELALGVTYDPETGEIGEPPIGSVIFLTGWRADSKSTEMRRLDYAIIRAGNGRWYTTGRSCPAFGYTWESLVRFMQSFHEPSVERLR